MALNGNILCCPGGGRILSREGLERLEERGLAYPAHESLGDAWSHLLPDWSSPFCSSLAAILLRPTRWGCPWPLQARGHISLLPANEHWKLDANVLYLASPAGVGYSYPLSQNYQTDDQPVGGCATQGGTERMEGKEEEQDSKMEVEGGQESRSWCERKCLMSQTRGCKQVACVLWPFSPWTSFLWSACCLGGGKLEF